MTTTNSIQSSLYPTTKTEVLGTGQQKRMLILMSVQMSSWYINDIIF